MKLRTILTTLALPALAALTACVPIVPSPPGPAPAPAPVSSSTPSLRPPLRQPDERIEIGRSAQGRPVIAERFGAGPNVVLLVGQIHGNELAPNIVTDAVAAFPWDGSTTAWVIRTLNPDGAAVGQRLNGQGIDLNRDGLRKHAFETRTLDNFVNVYRPRVVVHVHSPSNYLGYWGGPTAQRIAGNVAYRTGVPNRGQIANCGGAPHCLWRGHSGETVLFEVPAINGQDCRTCWDSRAQTDVDDVHWRAWVLLEETDAAL